MPTYPSPSDPVQALTRAGGETEAHSSDHGRVIGMWENVRRFGARGDDTDDTDAFEECIDYVKTNQGAGIIVPPTRGGVYGISRTLKPGVPYAGASGPTYGFRFMGHSGPAASQQTSGISRLGWVGANGGGPIMELRQTWGAIIDGVSMDAGNDAIYPLRVIHATGDTQSPHQVVVQNLTLARGKTYNLMLGAEPVSTPGWNGDTAQIIFDNVGFVANAGNTATANVRGTSANALPVVFRSPHMAADRDVMEYHFDLDGGTVNVHDGLSSGATVAAVRMRGTGGVPPNMNVFHWESQGDVAFMVTDKGTGTSQRATTLTGVYHGSDGLLTLDDDALVWDFPYYASLAINGGRLEGNLNVTEPLAAVFVNGLMFIDTAGTVIGETDRVSGHWFDTNTGQDKWHFQTAGNEGSLGIPGDVTGSRPFTDGIVRPGALFYDTTLDKLIHVKNDGTWDTGVTDKLMSLSGGHDPDCSLGNHFESAMSVTPQVMSAPANPVIGMKISFFIQNVTGGVLALTWNAVYLLAGAWVNPADTKSRSISFVYNGTYWCELSRTPADM